MFAAELKVAYSAPNLTDAHLVVQALAAEGIAAQIMNKSLQNVVGEVPYLKALPEVWVRSEDHARARRLIECKFQETTADEPQTDWLCPRCGESNGPAFDLCWKCEYNRAGRTK